jgi:hypothetical protein
VALLRQECSAMTEIAHYLDAFAQVFQSGREALSRV